MIEFYVDLETNPSKLTIMNVQFANEKDFQKALYAISSNMVEGWKPTKKDVERVKKYIEEGNKR